ncbi:ATP-binding cassette domain-containing protein [Vannielia litorea]|uniref:ABC transporter ATP-binding protein n=1 Tax=Vannielia litorea TaxID=1217970 RepID=UPI001C967D6A|nr:ATP-binding cassette domain-containing protein [Vannielia litorea]MBY6154674.1 ATP-binding cassette domain-containing protein [Vannielia litorea]
MTGIALTDIRKSYANGPQVLHGVSMSIQPGEFVVIVGPSGCGKSTLLRMIAGLEACTEGEIAIGGRRVNEVAPRDRDIAMIFQNYALYPHMTVRENISFGLELRGVKRAERHARAEEVARMLHLDPYLNRKPGALSGGQRQRVAMGRAMARDAGVFLMDEPLSNLDNALRVEMRAEIKALHRKVGATLVYVTHDQTEALSMADRIAVMKDGHLQQFDTPAAIYDRPANRFVAGFLGQPPMNFVLARDMPGWTGGKDITLGLRPDTISVAPSGEGLQGRVVLSEMTGSDLILHCETDAGRLVITAPRHQLDAVGETVSLRPDLTRAHAFDTATGARLDNPLQARTAEPAMV